MRNASVLLDPTIRFFDRWLGGANAPAEGGSTPTAAPRTSPGTVADGSPSVDSNQPTSADPWPPLMGAVVLGLGFLLGTTTWLQLTLVRRLPPRRGRRAAGSRGDPTGSE